MKFRSLLKIHYVRTSIKIKSASLSNFLYCNLQHINFFLYWFILCKNNGKNEPSEILSSFWLYQWVQLWQIGTAGDTRSVWLPSVCQNFHCLFFTVSLTSIINPELSGKGASLLAFLRVYLKSQYFHSLFSTVRDILSARSGKKYDSYDSLKV